MCGLGERVARGAGLRGWLVALGLAGCGGQVVFDEPSADGSGGQVGAGLSGSGAASAGGASSGGASSGGSSGGSAEAGAGGAGRPCGQASSSSCEDGQLCSFPDGFCGLEAVGACISEPVDCAGEPTMEVCCCDGEVYSNPCEAQLAGADLAFYSGCVPPTGMFVCGFTYCSKGVEVCATTISADTGLPVAFECIEPPPGCGPSDCSCALPPDCRVCAASIEGDLSVWCARG
jgi:hypothetical protein